MPCSCTVHFDQQLLDHIKYHRNAEAISMLNKNLAIASDCRGTLLHHAAAVGNKVIAKHLIDLGSLIEYPGPGAKTPLVLAMERGSESVVRVLLEAEADINIVDADGQSALCRAVHAKFNDLQVAEPIFLRARAESPTTEELIERLLAVGCTFPYFVLLRDVNVLEKLLQRGFSVNSRTSSKGTALHFAAMIKDFKSAELLVVRGADVNASDNCAVGPLYYAAKRADPGMLRFLLDHGANTTPARLIEKLPLSGCLIARENNDEQVRECAEILLDHGAFPWRPRSFVKKIECYNDEILRSSRLNSLVAHQAALDAYGVPSCKDEEHLRTFVELTEYYDECREILKIEVAEKMTVVKLLFVDNDHEIKLRARDQRFVRQAEQFCARQKFKGTFSYYARILQKQIDKAVRTVKLKRKASLVVCSLFKCDDNQLSIFARQVVSYLSESDLEQLCRV